jgi:CRP/FNR family transcriptional regulator, anaerobic regulatory protein
LRLIKHAMWLRGVSRVAFAELNAQNASMGSTTIIDLGEPARETAKLKLNFCTGSANCANSCATCQVRALGVCGAIEASELSEIEAILDHVDVDARTALFLQGDAAGHVYTLTSGCVRLSKDLHDGRRQIVGFALPGDFLGLSMGGHYGFTADALEHVGLCRFRTRDFAAFLERKPHVMRRMHEMAAHELTIAQDQMVVLGRRRAEERVAAFLLDWRERLRRVTGADHTLHLPMTRQDMADYLGLTIETVSRTISSFVRQKWLLIIPDGIRILDAAALRRLLG